MATPFPTPYAKLPEDDQALGDALAQAIEELPTNFPALARPLRTAISIVAIDEDPLSFRHAGSKATGVFFSASLLKMAALYAAYELRQSVNALAAESDVGNAGDLFALLHSEFDDTIANAVALIPHGIAPKYEKIFAAVPSTSGGLGLAFLDTFQLNLLNMIISSDNNAASACIQALGYSWINGTLQAGGYFDADSRTGIWLAGTFTGALPPVRIPCLNDGPTAQGTTCFDMANLYAHIFQGTLVNNDSSNDMLAMLGTSASVGPDPSFMDFTRRHVPARSFTVTHTKVGAGSLNSGPTVNSEGSIVEHGDTGRKFLAVWQNTFKDDPSTFAMGFLVDRTIQLFLGTA
jgi:beta-lactamase family protein